MNHVYLAMSNYQRLYIYPIVFPLWLFFVRVKSPWLDHMEVCLLGTESWNLLLYWQVGVGESSPKKVV